MTYPGIGQVTWHTLTGAQAHFASGSGGVRRYAAGFSPIIAFSDPQQPDFDSLAAVCEPGEHFYVDGWSGPVPEGWKLDAQKAMYRMVWEGAMPDRDEAPDAVRLDASHTAQALELVGLTKPGPFGPRTLELGEYFGFFDGDRLVAMAGERMNAPPLREISGVCTHPDHQGKGLARKLMVKLIRRQMARGEAPFLHVMTDNTGAQGLYERMGFRIHDEAVVRVLSRC
jgi:ribosomal protein S18 acetylase RimI-like enzyme